VHGPISTDGMRGATRIRGCASFQSLEASPASVDEVQGHGSRLSATGASLGSMIPRSIRRSRARLRDATLLGAVALVLAGCGTVSFTQPPATPTDFPGLTGRLNAAGIKVSSFVSGDPGCSDPDLTRAAIKFDAQGLDQATPATLYLYIFNNRAAFERNLGKIGPCAASFVTDPQTFQQIEQSPYVIASQGPWAPQFESVLRATLEKAAGTGDSSGGE
jgi:hypothetical protein